MRLYVAGKYGRRAELQLVAERLRGIGVEVTSRWLEGSSGVGVHDHAPPMDCALEDLQDIDRSDGLLLFTELPDAGYMTGGRHFEAGYAYGRGLRLWLVGPAENVFYHRPDVQRFKTVDDWLEQHPRPRGPA